MKFTTEQMKKIREAYYFVTEFKKHLEKIRNTNSLVNHSVIRKYVEYLQSFNKVVPDTLKNINLSEYVYNDPFGPSVFNGPEYQIDALIVRTIEDISALKIIIDAEEELPITQQKDFSFVNGDLKLIVERDYNWVTECLVLKAWKPAIILSGGLIEALLLNELIKDEEKARASSKAPQERDLLKWDLNDLIDVSVDLEIVGDGVEKLGHGVRQYRNLIHPGNELRKGLKIEPEEAKIAFEVLSIVIRDLSNKVN